MSSKSQPKIVLASTSPQRLAILTAAKFEFEVIKPEYEEIDELFLSPLEQAKKHAFGKAKSVADILQEGIIIGCDTVVSLNGKLIGKAKDMAHAKEIITSLQGNTAQVISGLCVFNADLQRNIATTVTSEVTLNPLTEGEIDWYISTGEWKDKSGAFSVQGIGSRYIKEIKGDYHNIVGLPVSKLYEILKTWI
jgi:septum formation protein